MVDRAPGKVLTNKNTKHFIPEGGTAAFENGNGGGSPGPARAGELPAARAPGGRPARAAVMRVSADLAQASIVLEHPPGVRGAHCGSSSVRATPSPTPGWRPTSAGPLRGGPLGRLRLDGGGGAQVPGQAPRPAFSPVGPAAETGARGVPAPGLRAGLRARWPVCAGRSRTARRRLAERRREPWPGCGTPRSWRWRATRCSGCPRVSALRRFGDVDLSEQTVLIRRSKTDQEGKPAWCSTSENRRWSASASGFLGSGSDARGALPGREQGGAGCAVRPPDGQDHQVDHHTPVG